MLIPSNFMTEYIPVPKFPESVPLEREHQQMVERALAHNPPRISELTFTNLYAWRHSYCLQVSSLGDSIILRSDCTWGSGYFMPLGEINAALTAARTILAIPGARIIRADSFFVEHFKHLPSYCVEFDRNNSDYMYATQDLVSLKGSKYDGKRNLIKQFITLHEDCVYATITPRDIETCLAFEDAWCKNKDCGPQTGLGHEKEALRSMLNHMDEFHVIGAALYIKGGMHALALGQALNNQTFVVHILKAMNSIKGLYQYMTREFLARHASGFTFVNLEEDLGIEGLRKAKNSYHPCAMIDKYTIHQKT